MTDTTEFTYTIKRLTAVELLHINTSVMYDNGRTMIALDKSDWEKIMGHIAATEGTKDE